MNTLLNDVLVHHIIPMLFQPIVAVDKWAARLYKRKTSCAFSLLLPSTSTRVSFYS